MKFFTKTIEGEYVECNTIQLQENDILVVDLPNKITKEQAVLAKKSMEQCFPNNKVIIKAKDVDISVVSK